MRNRVKQIRKDAKKTQQAFAESIGLSQNFIAQYETGKKENISDRTIRDICRTYNVNEDWLRTGNGEMYNLPTDDVADVVSDLLEGDGAFNDTIINIVRTYMKLDKESKSVIDSFIKDLSGHGQE